MNDTIFVKTRYQDIGYHSYRDFWRLVELSGYPVIYVDQIDPHDASKTYIVTPLNSEWTKGWPNARARITHYELEWRTDWRAGVDTPPGVSEVWTMDAAYAKRIGAQYVPIGSHPDLKLSTKVGTRPRYDACLLSYMVGRRQQIAHDLKMRGVRLAPHDNLWDDRRHEVLSQTRALIHIHQHEGVRGVACLRWAIAAAYSLPIISETIDDRGIFGHSHMLMSDYANLPAFAAMWLRRNEAHILEDYGRALHGLLCRDQTFRKCVEAAL